MRPDGATRAGLPSHRAALALLCALLFAPTARAQGVDLAAETGSYALDARLDEARRVIDGELTVSLENRSERPLTELWWHLYANAFRGPDSLFMRSGGALHRGHASSSRGSIELTSLALVEGGDDLLPLAEGDRAYPGDRTQLRTPLPRPVAPGATVTVRARFRTVLPHASARMGYAGEYVLAGQWFPKLARLERDGSFAHFPYHSNAEFYADFARYRLTVRVPAGTVVGATGSLSRPVERAGAYETHTYEARSVHDAAFAAWPHFRERWSQSGATRIRVLYPPGMHDSAVRQEYAVGYALRALGERFGPYPYPQLTVVLPPPDGEGTAGMEYPTMITTGGYPFVPASAHDDAHLAVHETAHQWFYGLVATNEWAHPFLDEGVTEYETGRVLAQMYGRGRELGALGALWVGSDALHGAVTGVFGATGAVTRGASEFPSQNVYAAQVYSRTAATLRTAEWVAGEGVVSRALERYARTQRFAHPGPDEFFTAFALEPGGPALLERFLRPALQGDARISLAISAVESSRARVLRGGSPVAAAVPVVVRFTAVDGAWADARWEPGAPPGASAWVGAPESVRGRVVSAQVDPEARVPLDEDRLDNARAVEGRAGGVASMGARAGALLAWALRLLGP